MDIVFKVLESLIYRVDTEGQNYIADKFAKFTRALVVAELSKSLRPDAPGYDKAAEAIHAEVVKLLEELTNNNQLVFSPFPQTETKDSNKQQQAESQDSNKDKPEHN